MKRMMPCVLLVCSCASTSGESSLSRVRTQSARADRLADAYFRAPPGPEKWKMAQVVRIAYHAVERRLEEQEIVEDFVKAFAPNKRVVALEKALAERPAAVCDPKDPYASEHALLCRSHILHMSVWMPLFCLDAVQKAAAAAAVRNDPALATCAASWIWPHLTEPNTIGNVLEQYDRRYRDYVVASLRPLYEMSGTHDSVIVTFARALYVQSLALEEVGACDAARSARSDALRVLPGIYDSTPRPCPDPKE